MEDELGEELARLPCIQQRPEVGKSHAANASGAFAAEQHRLFV